jgi:hypothetical protein
MPATCPTNPILLTLSSYYLMVKNTIYVSVILCSCTQSLVARNIYLSTLFSSILKLSSDFGSMVNHTADREPLTLNYILKHSRVQVDSI